MYSDSKKYEKNVLTFDLDYENKPDTALIKNTVTHEFRSINLITDRPLSLSFEAFEPGFFEVSLFKSSQKIHYFTADQMFTYRC